MEVDDNGLNFILGWEGFIPYLYNDPKNATVAIGILVHLGLYHEQRGICAKCDEWPRVSDPVSMWIPDDKAIALLKDKIYGRGRFIGDSNYAAAVEQNTRKLNQNEFDALVDFTYNEGVSGYARSSVRAAVNAGGDVCAELVQYILPASASVALLARRQAECQLFYTPVEDDMGMTQEEQARFNDLGASVWKHGLQINEFGKAFFPLARDYYTTQKQDVQQQARLDQLEKELNDLTAFKPPP